jgi:two-component system chemotaxis response regulator CheY
MKSNVNVMPEMLNKRPPLGLDKTGNPLRVLVVDDSSTMRRLVCQKLKAEAFEICGEAVNGKETLERYKELSPDAVTLDINMPEMSGLEALEALIEYDRNAKVIMITGEGHSETVLQAIRMGASGYMVKPFNKGNLCQKVKEAIENN